MYTALKYIQDGPMSLDRSTMSSFFEERMFITKYKSHLPTSKSILGITRIIIKVCQLWSTDNVEVTTY